jgi:UDP-N-acetylglucosamine:LPS N-acetylglucosamine transferase
MSTSAGAGHIRAAQALERAFIEMGAAAADILVRKTGGLTTSEALARDLIMMAVNPIPCREERKADHVLEKGAALRCNNLPAITCKIDRLLDDPARMAAMKKISAALHARAQRMILSQRTSAGNELRA